MKLLAFIHFSRKYNRAGGEIYIHRLFSEFARLGATVDVLVLYPGDPHYGETYQLDGVNYYHTDVNSKVLIKSCDAIMSHLDQTRLAYAVSHKSGKPLLLVVHNYDSVYLPLIKDPYIIKVYNSVVTQQYWQHQFPHSQYVTVPPTLDPVQFAPRPPDQRQYILLVNNIPMKGVQVFFELAKALPKFKFAILRGGYSQNYAQQYRLKNVSYFSQTDNPADVYRRAKIMLCPSTMETYGMAAFEACHMGIPVLHSDLLSLNDHINQPFLRNKIYWNPKEVPAAPRSLADLTLRKHNPYTSNLKEVVQQYAEKITKLMTDPILYQQVCQAVQTEAVQTLESNERALSGFVKNTIKQLQVSKDQKQI